MGKSQILPKTLAIIALAALGILLIGSFVFYKERVLFADGAFFVFNIVNYKTMAIQWNRYGSFVSQMFPYLGQKLHLPLKILLILYSVSFNLFYFFAALLSYWYKEYLLVVLTALFYFLLFSDSYFWVSEVPQAIGWLFICFGTSLYLGKKQKNILLLSVVFFLLLYLSLSTHFVAIIPAVFIWVYLAIEKETRFFSKKQFIVLSCVFLGIIAYRFSGTQSQSGENDHLHRVTHFSLQDIIDAFNTPVIQMFLNRCTTIYWVTTAIFITCIVTLFKNRKFKLAAWVIVCTLGYFIIMGLAYGDYDKDLALFHIESEWQSLAIIIATPFVFYFLPRLKPSFSITLLIIVFAVRLGYIYASLPVFSWRNQFKEQVLAQMEKKGITKLGLYNDDVIRKRCILDWGFTYETLLASGIKGDKPLRTFFFVNKDNKQVQEMTTGNKGFYDVWGMIPVANLNSSLFTIDTSCAYRIMSYEELFK